MDMTNEEKKELLQQMQEDFNGCPLMTDREKGSLDDLTGNQVTIDDTFKLSDYHCITFKEYPDKFFLTGGALKDLCNKYPKEAVTGLCIEMLEKVKVKSDNKKDFRPIRVLGYTE